MANKKIKSDDHRQIKQIKEWRRLESVVIKKTKDWVFVDCDNWLFTWIIMKKEVANLIKWWLDLAVGTKIEVEVINPNVKHDQWYYIVSVTRLLQVSIRNDLLSKANEWAIFEVVPTEANLWWLLIDMHNIKWFIPLSQLAPIHYPRVEDWDQEVIFDKLIDLVWQKFKVKIVSIDEDEKRIVMSEKEALKEETENIINNINIWNVYDWVVSWVSSYGLFVTLGWSVEWLVHISELIYWHVSNIKKLWTVWQKLKVKVIWYENGKISLSAKQLKEDPRSIIEREFKIWDVIEWEVVRFVPYWVFIKMFEDINWLIHLTELSSEGIENPAEAVRIWQVVKAKIILIDQKNKKVWLSMRALFETEEEQKSRISQKYKPKVSYKKIYKTEDSKENSENKLTQKDEESDTDV